MKRQRRDTIAGHLRQRILTAGHLGLMQPGERLPGIRQLAAEFGTTQRVIMAALRDLERQGLVEFRPRSGVYVAPDQSSRTITTDWMPDRALPLLREAILRGEPALNVPERLRLLLRSVRVRAVCVECNDDPSDALCRELARDYGIDSRPLSVEALGEPGATRALARADIVVTAGYHEAPVRAAAEAAGVPLLSA